MKFWTLTDPDGREYVFSVTPIRAVARESNWIAIYYDKNILRFEYATVEAAVSVLESFQRLVE